MTSFNPRPHRLAHLYQDYSPPLYFVTFCTMDRQPVLANDGVHRALIQYAEEALGRASVAVGRFVIMLDHVHLFVRGPDGFQLGIWVRGLKRCISRELRRMRTSAPQEQAEKGVWQEGLFDHIIRHSESYREKWEYVWQNPVRAGLVRNAEEWPYQGEIVAIDRV